MAWQSAYGGGYSWTHESNINHSATDPRSEWIEVLFVGAAFEEHEADFNGRLLAQAEARNYVRNVYGDDKGLYVNGSAVWNVAPRLMSWSVDELYRESLIDIAQPDVPTNRARNNTLSTGPDFTLTFNSTNFAEVGGRISRYDIRGPGDNRRRSLYTRLVHRRSARTNLSMNYEVADIHYTDLVTEPSQVLREDWFVRVERLPTPHQMTLDVGRTRVTPSGRESLEGKLVRFTGTRQLTSESALRAWYERQYSDTFSDSLRWVVTPSVPGGSVLIPTGSDAAAGDSYLGKRGELSYERGDPSGRLSYSGSVFARDVDYVTSNSDYREHGGRLDWGWRPFGETRLYATTAQTKRHFTGLEQTDIDRYSAVGAIYAISRSLSLTLEGSRLSRTSDGPLGTYVDWRGMIQLGYSSHPLYAPMSRR